MSGRKGQCGWTWYTGSSAWMYRTWIEFVLGFRLRGDRLTIRPAIPSGWPGFEMTYRYGSTPYQITVSRKTTTELVLEVDGDPARDATAQLIDDGAIHRIAVWVPQVPPPQHDVKAQETTVAM